jgi:hypothetical protein
MIERCKDSSEAAAVHLAASLNNLANVLRSQRDDEKAELLYWCAAAPLPRGPAALRWFACHCSGL